MVSISIKGNKCKPIVADVSKQKSILTVYDQIDNKENIELLINNAGIAMFGNISDLSFCCLFRNKIIGNIYFFLFFQVSQILVVQPRIMTRMTK